jgi:hypothetical protein
MRRLREAQNVFEIDSGLREIVAAKQVNETVIKVLKDKINDLNVRISKMDSNTDTMISIVEQIKKIHLPDKKSRTPSGKGINAVRFLR